MVYTVRIGWGDVDFARNIFWARYFDYVEHAIGELVLSKGLSWQELIGEKGIGLPAVSLHVNFTRPVRLQEVIEIEVGVKEVTRRGCRFVFNIRRQHDGELAASGSVTRRFIDHQAFKGTELPDDLYRVFLEMEAETQGVEEPLERP